MVALSTIGIEYMVMIEAAKEAVWLKGLIGDEYLSRYDSCVL